MKRAARKPAPKAKPAAKPAAKLEQARQLYESFTGHQAETLGSIPKPEFPDVAVCMGELLGVSYRATRDGVTEDYWHDFRASSRPLLCVTPDGGQLIVAGGRYRVTETGINDR